MREWRYIVILMAAICFPSWVPYQQNHPFHKIEMILTRKEGWKVLKQEIYPPVPIRGEPISDLTTLFEECDRDDVVKFFSNVDRTGGEMINFPGSMLCDPTDDRYPIAKLRYDFNREDPGFYGTSLDTGEEIFWKILEISDRKLIIQARNEHKSLTDHFIANHE